MIASERIPATAPISFKRCPVHHQLVAFDGDGRRLGCCSACVLEAAGAMRLIRRGLWHGYR